MYIHFVMAFRIRSNHYKYIPMCASLIEKVGQLFMAAVEGPALSEEQAKLIQAYSIGGVILYCRNNNCNSYETTTKLCKHLQSISKVPMLISIDQEGGCISNLVTVNGFPSTRSHATLGELDPQESYEEGALIGKMLKQCGININLAPVVDININKLNPIIGKYERSFSDDYKKVIERAQKYIEGLHSQGIFSTIKHFPGHGSSVNDSHKEKTDVTKFYQMDAELAPYKALCPISELVMTAHIINEKMDTLPATLSKKILDGILRKEIGFKGVIISDALNMNAISVYFTKEEAALKCLVAGSDIILTAENIQSIISSIEYIVKEAKDNKEIQARIDESYARVMELKKRII